MDGLREFPASPPTRSGMNGTIVFRNPAAGRYGVRTENGHYATFQILTGGIVLDAGEDVIDELDESGVHTVHSKKRGDLNVFVEKTRLNREAAEAWVKG